MGPPGLTRLPQTPTGPSPPGGGPVGVRGARPRERLRREGGRLGPDDRDGDGEDDEDEGDRYGTIASYDPASRLLGVQATSGMSYTFTLSADAEIEFEDADHLDCPDAEDHDGDNDGDSDADEDGDTSLLVNGAAITELELERGLVEEVELLRNTCA